MHLKDAQSEENILNRLEGVIVSIITPFKNDKIDYKKLEQNIKKLNTTLISGYLALGGNAESQSLSDEEKLELITFINSHNKDKLLFAGIYSESTSLILKTIEKYNEIDIDYIRLAPPHYFPYIVNNALLRNFYTEIADSSPIPLVLYNAPKLTGGMSLSTDLVSELSDHSNIHGIKDSSLTGLYKFINLQRNNKDFRILAGSASFFFPALMAGASGGDMTAANYLPDHCCNLYELVKIGRLEEAKSLHGRILAVNSYISENWGFCGVKAAMNILGYGGGEPRRPYQLPDNTDVKKIEMILKKEGFLS